MSDETQTATSTDRAAPYVSFTSLKNFFTMLKASGGVPIIIDNSVFAGMSGGYRTQMKTALRFLGLIDKESKPTVDLHIAVESVADADLWKVFVRGLLEKYYASILSHPLTETTPTAIRKEFESAFGGNADLITKSITFFVHAAREADIPLSPRLTERQKGGKRGPRRKSAETAPAAEESRKPTEPASPATKPRKVSEHQMILIEIINTYEKMPAEMRDSILGVVGFIATQGGGAV